MTRLLSAIVVIALTMTLTVATSAVARAQAHVNTTLQGFAGRDLRTNDQTSSPVYASPNAFCQSIIDFIAVDAKHADAATQARNTREQAREQTHIVEPGTLVHVLKVTASYCDGFDSLPRDYGRLMQPTMAEVIVTDPMSSYDGKTVWINAWALPGMPLLHP